MSYIRVDLTTPIENGQTLTFRSPADCSGITGLKVYYKKSGSTSKRIFQFADAHGNNVGSTSLFAEDVLVKVILDMELDRAYVQNADTNAYLEGRLNILGIESTVTSSNKSKALYREVDGNTEWITFPDYCKSGTRLMSEKNWSGWPIYTTSRTNIQIPAIGQTNTVFVAESSSRAGIHPIEFRGILRDEYGSGYTFHQFPVIDGHGTVLCSAKLSYSYTPTSSGTYMMYLIVTNHSIDTHGYCVADFLIKYAVRGGLPNE